jgi:uncharacterized membrane protein
MVGLVALHIISAVIWVGGMALHIWFCARPLDRSSLLHVSCSGVESSAFSSGLRGVGVHVHIMQAVGIVMMLLFVYLFVSPWRRFQAAVDNGVLPEASGALGQIRLVVATNLVLGLGRRRRDGTILVKDANTGDLATAAALSLMPDELQAASDKANSRTIGQTRAVLFPATTTFVITRYPRGRLVDRLI